MTLPSLWLCADLDHPAAHAHAALLARFSAVARVSPAALWLRAPDGFSARALLSLARASVEIALATRSIVMVGDRVDVALCAGARGAHLPERSLSPEGARSLAKAFQRDDFIVSCATHDADGLRRASRCADVAVLSPFGEVSGKGAALGEGAFRALRETVPALFVVALGGVSTANDARSARRAGADGFAIRRAWLDAIDPARTCAELLRAFEHPS